MRYVQSPQRSVALEALLSFALVSYLSMCVCLSVSVPRSLYLVFSRDLEHSVSALPPSPDLNLLFPLFVVLLRFCYLSWLSCLSLSLSLRPRSLFHTSLCSLRFQQCQANPLQAKPLPHCPHLGESFPDTSKLVSQRRIGPACGGWPQHKRVLLDASAREARLKGDPVSASRELQ